MATEALAVGPLSSPAVRGGDADDGQGFFALSSGVSDRRFKRNADDAAWGPK